MSGPCQGKASSIGSGSSHVRPQMLRQDPHTHTHTFSVSIYVSVCLSLLVPSLLTISC